MERIIDYKDPFPFLAIRKRIMYSRKVFTNIVGAIVAHKAFEYISLTVIVANSLVLAMEDPQK